MGPAGGRQRPAKGRRAADAALFLLVFFGGWQATALAVGAGYVVPGPLDVGARALQLGTTADFWRSVALSLARIFAGFAIGMVAGVMLAVAMHGAPRLRTVLAPFVKILRTTPMVCFVLVLLLWASSTVIPTLVAALMVLPVFWTHAIEGLDAASAAYADVVRVFRISRMKAFWSIYLPSLSGELAAAAEVGMGLAWKSGVTAEVLALPPFAIGTGVYRAKLALEGPDLFVWTIAIVLLSLALEAALRALTRRWRLARADEAAGEGDSDEARSRR